jgi:hypothetical protein
VDSLDGLGQEKRKGKKKKRNQLSTTTRIIMSERANSDTYEGQEWAQLSGQMDNLVKQLIERNGDLSKRVRDLEGELDVYKVRVRAPFLGLCISR